MEENDRTLLNFDASDSSDEDDERLHVPPDMLEVPGVNLGSWNQLFQLKSIKYTLSV